MSKYADLFNWLRTCPALSNLWSIAAEEEIGVRVVLPQGASQSFQYRERVDTIDGYECDIIPFPSVYEDYQINCYAAYDANDSSEPEYNLNVLNIDDVQSIIDWIFDESAAGRVPEIEGEQVISVECVPRVPQIRYINAEESTIGYFITVRVRYVNKAVARSVYYERNG